MGISTIKILNFKSIKELSIDFDKTESDIYCMLGKNGAGKTTVIDAIRYLYKKANNPLETETVIDRLNIYAQKMYIEVIFDFSNLLNNNKNSYLDNILKMYEEYIIDNKLLIRMTQYKNGNIVWYPLDDVFFIRKILKIFPVFIVNTRFISLTDWSELWNTISEISVSGIKESTEMVSEKLKEVFEDAYGEKFDKSIRKIKKIFGEENIKINDKDYLIRFKNAIMTQLGGDTFLADNNSLLYYSDGMNSLKYIKLLTKLIVELSETAWKNSLIILDEPEIGLHPKYIEELADLFSANNSKKVKYLMTTHSTHFVSSVLKNGIAICFYRIYLSRGYSKLEKIQDIIHEKDKFLVNDAEAESYFSDVVIFVEGQTEIQILKHRKLVNMFPELRRITIYNTKSTDTITSIITPEFANMTVPYINILDMDKILTYNQGIFSFTKSRLNPLYSEKIKKKEKYLVYKKYGKKYYTYNLRQRILGIINNYKFLQDSTKFWIDDKKFKYLLKLVKLYCYENNVYVMKTTIEGALVNEHNNDIILNWLNIKLHNNTFQKLCKLLDNETDCVSYKTTILRLILNGKLDNLQNMTYKQDNQGKIQANVPKNVYDDVVSIKNKIGKKVDGWIIEFMDFYFDTYLIKEKEKNLEMFEKDFPELYSILQIINNLLQ